MKAINNRINEIAISEKNQNQWRESGSVEIGSGVWQNNGENERKKKSAKAAKNVSAIVSAAANIESGINK
jgi:hypothetical protein